MRPAYRAGDESGRGSGRVDALGPGRVRPRNPVPGTRATFLGKGCLVWAEKGERNWGHGERRGSQSGRMRELLPPFFSPFCFSLVLFRFFFLFAESRPGNGPAAAVRRNNGGSLAIAARDRLHLPRRGFDNNALFSFTPFRAGAERGFPTQDRVQVRGEGQLIMSARRLSALFYSSLALPPLAVRPRLSVGRIMAPSPLPWRDAEMLCRALVAVPCVRFASLAGVSGATKNWGFTEET